MNKVLISRLLALGALVLGTSNVAQAAIVAYDDQAAFKARAFRPGVDTFSDISVIEATPSPLTRSAGAYGYTASVLNSFFGAGTVDDPWLSSNQAIRTITFSGFVGPVNAIGGNFFDTDFASLFVSGGVQLVASDSLGATLTQVITPTSPSDFHGFISDGFLVSLSVTAVQPLAGFHWPTIDNLTFAVVPEPGSPALVAAALGAFMLAARRRVRRK